LTGKAPWHYVPRATSRKESIVVNKDLFLDIRLQEKSLRDGKLGRDVLKSHIEGLADASGNKVDYDEDGNPTNIPERELKTLPIKPEEPEEVLTAPLGALIDPLDEAWLG